MKLYFVSSDRESKGFLKPKGLAALLLVFVPLLQACGQKGDLYLPIDNHKAVSQSEIDTEQLNRSENRRTSQKNTK